MSTSYLNWSPKCSKINYFSVYYSIHTQIFINGYFQVYETHVTYSFSQEHLKLLELLFIALLSPVCLSQVHFEEKYLFKRELG